MGLAEQCIFKQIRLFSVTQLDLMGPYLLQSGEQIYALVALCLQSKYVERLLLENRKAETNSRRQGRWHNEDDRQLTRNK